LEPSFPHQLCPETRRHLPYVRGEGRKIHVGLLHQRAYLVTGNDTDSQGYGHAFAGWPNSQLLTTFDPPGSVETYPSSINSVGAITGNYMDAASTVHGFVRDPLGMIVLFDPVGSKEPEPKALNDGGAIVGFYRDSNSVAHGFVRDPGERSLRSTRRRVPIRRRWGSMTGA
jgi:hypothetical protein